MKHHGSTRKQDEAGLKHALELGVLLTALLLLFEILGGRL